MRGKTTPGAAAAEEERLAVLESLDILDSLPESEFDAIVKAAQLALDADSAMISLIDRGRQWFKARENVDATETPRELSFCTYAIENAADLMVVPDTRADERFRDNPLVTGGPQVRFYAGAPLAVRNAALGTLCIISQTPRPQGLSPREADILTNLARATARAIEARAARQRAQRLEKARRVADARIKLALEAADMTVWSWDVGTGELVNFGRASDTSEVTTNSIEGFLAGIVEEDRAPLVQSIQASLKTEQPYHCEFRPLSDPARWYTATGQVVEDRADGRPAIITGVQFDSTPAKRAAEIAEVQAQELRHRVNNLIGLVDALAGRTARETDTLADFIALFRSRLQALARTQKVLLANNDHADLETLIEEVLAPFRKRDRSLITVDVPEIELSTSLSQAMTLVLHELTTNALKYGALRWPYGHIEITADVNAETLSVSWNEKAALTEQGPREENYVQIMSSGAGRSIVERMVEAQGGQIDFAFDKNGLVASLNVPL